MNVLVVELETRHQPIWGNGGVEEFWVTPFVMRRSLCLASEGSRVSTEHDVLTIWTGAAECLADNVPLNTQAHFSTGVKRYSSNVGNKWLSILGRAGGDGDGGGEGEAVGDTHFERNHQLHLWSKKKRKKKRPS